MSKGSNRRRENTALVEANWPFPDRKAEAVLREGFGWVIDREPVNLTPIAGKSFQFYEDVAGDQLCAATARKADQAYVEQTQQDNLAAANRQSVSPELRVHISRQAKILAAMERELRNTEQDATDGQ